MLENNQSTASIKSALAYGAGTAVLGAGAGAGLGYLTPISHGVFIGAGIGGGSGCLIGICCYATTRYICNLFIPKEHLPRTALSNPPATDLPLANIHLDSKYDIKMQR